jgi:hypothetical protein
MTPEMKARCLEIAREIRSDCEADVAEREGKPLTGRNVAKWLGEMNGLIVGLCNVVEKLVEDAVEG